MTFNGSQSTIDPPIISEEILWWLRMTLVGVITQLVALLGIVCNIINIIVYIKLGMKDSMNVSLLGLSISDFGGCLTIMWFNLCLFPPFMELELPFKQVGLHHLYGSYAHVAFSRVTTLITAFITMERWLCVTFPLKVKDIITTKRVTVVTVFFYVLTIALISPIYYVNYYDWVFSEERNRTLYTLVFQEERIEVEMITHWIIAVVVPFCSFCAIVIWTTLLVYNLKKNAKWRLEATGASSKPPDSSAKGSQVSSRDTKVANMVVMISALYIISNTPVMLSGLVMIFIPEMKEGKSQGNLVHFLFYFNFLLDTTNGALNIFIYYSMSSNFKAMFRKIFNFKENDKK